MVTQESKVSRRSTEVRPRIHSAKSNSATFGLFPNKEVEELTQTLVDLRVANTLQEEQLEVAKYQALDLMRKVMRKLGPDEMMASD